MYEQSETFFKQFNKIISLNTEAMSTHYGKQAEFVNAMMTESLDYAKGLPEKKSVEALYESQKAYWQSLQQRFSDNAKDTYELWNETSEKITGLFQGEQEVQQAKPAKTARSAPARKKVASKKAAPAPATEAPAAEAKPSEAPQQLQG